MAQHHSHPSAPLDYGNIITDPVRAFTGNCENIVGFVPVPLGVAGSVNFLFKDQSYTAQLPLATTEAALVASVNRGFKALRASLNPLKPVVENIGITRSAAFTVPDNFKLDAFAAQLEADVPKLNQLIAKQSRHTKLKQYELELRTNNLFINFYYDTGAAMGMNMATIATKLLADQYFDPEHQLELITVSANWCSDKKPSQHTLEKGRKFKTQLQALVPKETVESVLKTSSEAIEKVDQVKLRSGSKLAGALGENAHHANIIAASFIALGQDVVHTVDGSLGHSHFLATANGDLKCEINIPALVCGTIGGGTSLPVQSQVLELTQLPIENEIIDPEALAALITCGVLAGELSLMTALASQSLAASHQQLRREI